MTRGFRDEDEARRGRDDLDDVRIADVTCLRATQLAILVRIGAREVWIPQSVITDDSEVYALGHSGALVVKGWFAHKEGLES